MNRRQLMWQFIIIILIAIFVVLVNARRGWPADGEYCRAYAQKTTQLLHVWNRAYTSCLNKDEDPPLPVSRDDALAIINEGFPVLQDPAPDKVRPIGDLPIPAPAPRDRQLNEVSPHVCGRSSVSGFAIGTIEQTRWCKKNYRSFRPSDGTVLCVKPRRRSPCA